MTSGRRGAPARPRRPGGGRRFFARRRVCHFCREHIEHIDYKNLPLLRRYLSDRARIEPRRKTAVCARHQRPLALALKRARHIALLPFTPDQFRLPANTA